MNTQQIRDEIARLQGWKLLGDTGLLIDGTSVTLTAYHRQVFIETLNNYRYDKQNDHPIPDTLDAAVGVIEAAGYRVGTIDFDIDEDTNAYHAFAIAISKDGRIVDETLTCEQTFDGAKAAYHGIHWQLALACVKAQRKEGDA